MTIHWYPGHMATARREITEALPGVDLLIEVLDARIPRTSSNPHVALLRGNKPCVQILHKSDLADPAVTAAWLAHLSAIPGLHPIPYHHRQPQLLRTVMTAARGLVPTPKNRPLSAMILGIPNVGKSTLINLLAGRTIAKTGNKPALTQMQQRVRVSAELMLLDTPGFLWHKLTPEIRAYRLAVTGAISERAYQVEDLAAFAARFLLDSYPDRLRATYGLEPLPDEETAMLDAIGRRHGFLGRGGVIDPKRSAERLLADLRSGGLGPLSLETPDEVLDEG